MHLDILATVQTPVVARGIEIRNRHGDIVATCRDGWMAAAMAALINYGIPGGEQERIKHDAQESKIRDMFVAARKGESI